MNEFRELEKIHINLLEKKRLKGMQSHQEGSAEFQKIYDGRLVLEASKEDEGSCILKIDNCCVFAGHVNLREDKKLLETVILTGEKMTTHSHIKNKEKSYSQVKEDVQSDDIQRISQKEDGKGII